MSRRHAPLAVVAILPRLPRRRTAVAAPPEALEQSPVWTAGDDGYHTYRIPSLLVTNTAPSSPWPRVAATAPATPATSTW